MQKYGYIFDTGVDTQKEEIYYHITDYFKNPIMTKIKESGNFSIYMAKVNSLLLVEYKYIIALVPKNSNPLKSQEKLSELKWVSFQTRLLPENYYIPKHEYPKTKTPFNMSPINLIDRTDEQSSYSCEKYPIIISLLHSKKNSCEYMDKGTLIHALETYKTVVTFKN